MSQTPRGWNVYWFKVFEEVKTLRWKVFLTIDEKWHYLKIEEILKRVIQKYSLKNHGSRGKLAISKYLK